MNQATSSEKIISKASFLRIFFFVLHTVWSFFCKLELMVFGSQVASPAPSESLFKVGSLPFDVCCAHSKTEMSQGQALGGIYC